MDNTHILATKLRRNSKSAEDKIASISRDISTEFDSIKIFI